MTAAELDQALEMGMDWSLQKGAWPEADPPLHTDTHSTHTQIQHVYTYRRQPPRIPTESAPCTRLSVTLSVSVFSFCLCLGYAWPEDKEHCEEFGRMLQADSRKVSDRAKKRGLPQLGTLGAGNHYAEVQVVDEIFDQRAANKMGIDRIGQVCA
jgi:hypothetical protein